MTFEEAIDKYTEGIHAIAENRGIHPMEVAEDERRFVQGLILPSIPREDADRIIEALNNAVGSIDELHDLTDRRTR